MKKPTILFILFLFCISRAYSNSDSIQQSSNFSFLLGLDYSFPPFYGDNYGPKYAYPFDYNESKVISGERLTLGLEYVFPKLGIGLSFSGSIKYGHLHYTILDTNKSYAGAHTVQNSVTALTFDQHINVTKYIKLGKSSLGISVGYSYINFGSQFTVVNVVQKDYYSIDTRSFQYRGWKFGLSYAIRKLDIGFNMLYINRENHYFSDSRNIFVPSFSFRYRFKI